MITRTKWVIKRKYKFYNNYIKRFILNLKKYRKSCGKGRNIFNELRNVRFSSESVRKNFLFLRKSIILRLNLHNKKSSFFRGWKSVQVTKLFNVKN